MEEQHFKIKKIEITNFRGISNTETFELKDLNILIGENALSKTTILEAIHYAFNPAYAQSHTTYDDFHNGTNDPIVIEVYFNDKIPMNIQFGFHTYTIYFNRIGLHITKRNSNKGLKKALNSPFVLHHYLLPVGQKEGDQGWRVTDEQGNERHLTPLQASDALNNIPLRCFYFNTNRDKQTVRGFNSTISSIFEDFNWRFLKNLDEDGKNRYCNLKEELEKLVLTNVDTKIQSKILDSMNTKLKGSFDLPSTNVSFVSKDNPFNSAFLSNKETGIDLPTSKLGSGIEMITSVVLLETVATATNKDLILLIDEPELHLHPTLQKKLLNYLKSISSNAQVVFATHSPFMFKECYENDAIHLMGRGSTKIHHSLFPWGQTWGELNYYYYNTPTIEFFNELYGYIQSKNECIDEIEQFFNEKGIISDKVWKRPAKDGSTSEKQLTTISYIRNSIHHPENTLNEKYTNEEFEESIRKMIELISSDEHY